MNFSPQEQRILMVRCCSLKTQLRNFFLFNLCDRIKFASYLESAKEDPGGAVLRAAGSAPRQCLCAGGERIRAPAFPPT